LASAKAPLKVSFLTLKIRTHVDYTANQGSGGNNINVLEYSLTSSSREKNLKVPKRENFSLAFFAQSEPTWVCDLGRIFYQMTPVFDGFWFFAAY
jgi:hypothetical protein